MLKPDLKVLFIAGYSENATVGHGMVDKGMHAVIKLFAMDALFSKLCEMIKA